MKKPPVRQDGGFNAHWRYCSARFHSPHIDRKLSFPIKAPYVSIAGCQTSSRKSFLMLAEAIKFVLLRQNQFGRSFRSRRESQSLKVYLLTLPDWLIRKLWIYQVIP